MTEMDWPDDLFQAIQGVFRKTPMVLVGSGFSCGYGLPAMGALAEHLANAVPAALTTDAARNIWAQSLDAIKENLEAGLNSIPSGTEQWGEIVSVIRKETAALILKETIDAENRILQDKAAQPLAPSRLLKKLFEELPESADSIHLITTNYDTLLELFCDLAEIPLDTGFVGLRRRKLRPENLFQTLYRRKQVTEKRKPHVECRACKAIRLYKPHGSISWLQTEEGMLEVFNDISCNARAIVVPGPSKYQDSLLNSLFDRMRIEMNAALNGAQALLCIGFGFNDDHLQPVIEQRLTNKLPAIILTRSATPGINKLLGKHPHVIAIFKSDNGAICHWNNENFSTPKPLWQLDDFLKTIVEQDVS